MYPDKHRRGFGGKMIFIPFIAAVVLLTLGVVVQMLWNAIIPDVIHVSRISYWQAVGLLLLCRILVGGFGRSGFRGGSPFKKHQHSLREKWMDLTDEERAQMRQQWKERCRKRDA